MARKIQNQLTTQELTIDHNYLRLADAIMGWSAIDIKSPEQVQNRIEEYFHVCADAQIRPGVVGLAAALGMNRRRLTELVMGRYPAKTGKYDVPDECLVALKRAYMVLESSWEYCMQSGKINPVSGIFLGKNNFGYTDTQEYVLTPKTDSHVLPSDDLQKRLDTLPDE